MQVHQPHAVRSNHAHAVMADDFEAALLHLFTIHANFFEPARDNNDRLHAAFAAGFQRSRNGWHRQHNFSQLHRIRYPGNIRPGRLAQDFRGSGVNRINPALVSTLDEIAQDTVTQLAGVGGGTDYRHAGRVKERSEGRSH